MIPRTPDVARSAGAYGNAPLAHIRGPWYHVRQRDQWVPVQSAYVTSVV